MFHLCVAAMMAQKYSDIQHGRGGVTEQQTSSGMQAQSVEDDVEGARNVDDADQYVSDPVEQLESLMMNISTSEDLTLHYGTTEDLASHSSHNNDLRSTLSSSLHTSSLASNDVNNTGESLLSCNLPQQPSQVIAVQETRSPDPGQQAAYQQALCHIPQHSESPSTSSTNRSDQALDRQPQELSPTHSSTSSSKPNHKASDRQSEKLSASHGTSSSKPNPSTNSPNSSQQAPYHQPPCHLPQQLSKSPSASNSNPRHLRQRQELSESKSKPTTNPSHQALHRQSEELSSSHSSTSSSIRNRSTSSVSTDHESMQLSSSTSSLHSLDFTSIEIPEWEYPPEYRERQYDAVVISIEQDKQIAEVFKYVLTEFITLEVCGLISFTPHGLLS